MTICAMAKWHEWIGLDWEGNKLSVVTHAGQCSGAARDILAAGKSQTGMTLEWQAEELELDPVAMGSHGFYEQNGKRARLLLWEDHWWAQNGFERGTLGKMEKAENMVTLIQGGIRPLGRVVARQGRGAGVRKEVSSLKGDLVWKSMKHNIWHKQTLY